MNIETKKDNNKKYIDRDKIKEWLKEAASYIIFFIIVILILTKVLLVGSVASGSMEPTLRVGNKILINGLAYTLSEPKRGDIILFDFAIGEEDYKLTKRVIGLPGEKVSFKSGDVYIDDELLREDYLDEDVDTLSILTFVVPEDSYFVMGDNREDSLDSRFWVNPYVEKESIKGKLLLQIPLEDMKEKMRNIFQD